MTQAPTDNPFDALGLPTDADPQDLTARLRERIEDAKTEEERTALRAAWEQLTLHPETRVQQAIGAFPTGKEGPRPALQPQGSARTIPPVTMDELREETPLSFLIACAPPDDSEPPLERDPLLGIDPP